MRKYLKLVLLLIAVLAFCPIHAQSPWTNITIADSLPLPAQDVPYVSIWRCMTLGGDIFFYKNLWNETAEETEHYTF